MTNEDFSKMDTATLKKWITTRERNAMGGNLSKKRGDEYDQAQAELKKRDVKEELTDKTIRSSDKIKVARVIADMLGVEKAESMSPDLAVNQGLRNLRTKRLTPELSGVLRKMLELAKSVGIKVDDAMVPKALKEEIQVVASKDNEAGEFVTSKDDNAGRSILRMKDYLKLKAYSEMGMDGAPKVFEIDPTEVGHAISPSHEDDQLRRRKVMYKTESFNTMADQGNYHVNVTYYHGDDDQKVTKSYKIKNANDNRHASWKAMKIAKSDAEKAGHKVKSMSADWKKVNEQVIDYDTKKQKEKADKATDKAELVLKHAREREAMADRHHNQKMALKKEEVELEEAAGQHKVNVTVSEPDHPMVTKRKETVMKRVIVSADDKAHAVVKAKEYYKKKGYKVHDAEYHSAQPKSSMATEETEQIDELSDTLMTSYKDKAEKVVSVPTSHTKTATNIIKRKLKELASNSCSEQSMDEAQKLSPGWMLKQDPELKKKVDANKARHQAVKKALGNPAAGKSMQEENLDYSPKDDEQVIDMSDEELDQMANLVDSEDDILDEYDEDELAIVDEDTGEEVDDKEDVKEETLNEVLSRMERMRAKIRFMRTKSRRERRLKIVLKRRSDMKAITKRARRLAIRMIKQRLTKKPVSKLTVAEKERVEKMIQQRRAIIDRLAMRLVPRIRKIESDRLSHQKSAPTPGVGT